MATVYFTTKALALLVIVSRHMKFFHTSTTNLFTRILAMASQSRPHTTTLTYKYLRFLADYQGRLLGSERVSESKKLLLE